MYVCIIYNNNNSSSARAHIDPTETYLATVATNERTNEKKSARIRDRTSTGRCNAKSATRNQCNIRLFDYMCNTDDTDKHKQ